MDLSDTHLLQFNRDIGGPVELGVDSEDPRDQGDYAYPHLPKILNHSSKGPPPGHPRS